MKINCQPLSANPSVEPLDFEWDEAAGTVTGISADAIRAAAAEPGVPLHPAPAFHSFSATPLKTRADMAAIVGYLHHLPDELADDYPTIDDEPGLVEILDAEGRVVETLTVVF